MYTVMVIDDEEIVRRGIRDVIDWESEGFTICGEGKDGRDGLKKLLELKPDVALVDIKMPGFTGLELIRLAKEQSYGGHFIILTGFAEFEFAKSAISLGVKEYLLKPIDEDELVSILRRIKKELERLAYHRGNEQFAREELLRKILLRLNGKQELEDMMEQYYMDYGSQILCAAIVSDRDLQPGNDNHMFSEKVADLLEGGELYTEKVMMDSFEVLVRKEIDYAAWAERLSGKNEQIREKYGAGLIISVGHNVSNWYDLAHSYEFAKFLLEHAFLFGGRQVLSMDIIEAEEHMEEEPSVDYLCMLIEVGDMEGIRRSVERMRSYFRKTMTDERDTRLKILYDFMCIQNWAEKKYGDAGKEELQALLAQVNQAEELDKLLELFCEGLQNLCIEIGASGTETVIKRMYYYMEKNYEKDLKLETFGKMFHYNSNYLGKIFRKEMGDTFNNILDSIRITNAKRLLTETDLKIYQISERIGYGNVDYFYMKFRKYVGLTPKEYKQRNQKGELQEAKR